MALQYNLAKVYEISENDADFVKQIVTLFIDEVPIEIGSMKTGIEEKDYAKVYASSHKIKPSLDLLGMELSYDENIQIMQWTKAEGKRKEISEIFKSFKNRVEDGMKELKKDFNLK